MLASLVSKTASLRRAFYLTVFELSSTALWFSMFPVSKISDWAKSHCDGDYKLNIFKYYFLGLIGAANAVTVIGLSYLLFAMHFPVYLAAVLGAIAYPLMSGGIHLDGLSDTTDALLAYNKDKFQVLTDPHCGALGSVYTNLFTFAQVAIYATLLFLWLMTGVPAYLPILLSAVAARVGSFYILMDYYPKCHPQHLEHLFPAYHPIESLELGYNIYCLALPILAGVLMILFPSTIVPLAVASVATIFVSGVILPVIVRNLGLIYGDVLGTCILLTELFSCFALVPFYA